MQPTDTAAGAPTLSQIVSRVLGDLAFLIEDDSPSQPAANAAWINCEIMFRGPQEGALRCWCTRRFAERLTANLLGLDPQDPDASASAEDALRELMNVICGQLVTTWYGREAIFHLSIPVIRTDTPPVVDSDPWHTCRLAVEGEPFVCTSSATPLHVAAGATS